MIYWFANFPADPERFDYSREAYRADEGYLGRLVEEIEERFERFDEDQLLPCDVDAERCQYCRYRSFCQRGVEAGLLEEMAGESVSKDPFDFEMDFEQIAELEWR
jgi:hypothetical protein